MKVKLLLASVVLVWLAATAEAASVHFKQNRLPSTQDQGLTLQVRGCLAGLGNEDLVVSISGDAEAFATCFSPGGNDAPGQNPIAFEIDDSIEIDASQIKNGSVCFTLTTDVPETPSARTAGCPNDNWTVELDDVVFTDIDLTVVQGGVTVLGPTDIL